VRAFIIRRLAQAVAVLILVSILVFVLIHLIPGGPARAMLGPRASNREIQLFNIANGYNKSLPVQYITWLGQLLQGNLGYSIHYNQTVSSLLINNIGKSLVLVGLSVVVALIVAIPLGLYQATHRGKFSDHFLTTLTFVGYSMPVFWLGLLLILFFAVDLKIFPTEAPQGATIGAVLSDPKALVLPVLTLAIVTVAQFSLFARSSAIDSLVQEYIRTAKSKGVSQRRIVRKHVLRNSLLPIITQIGLSLPYILAGAVMTETVFNYPGMGLLFWNAATTHDYPLLLGFVMAIAVVTVLGSLIADLLYAAADPRIRLS
jgi:peptide/nickel transport system permease protein